MNTTLNSLDQVILVKNKVLNRIKVISSKFYSDDIDRPVLVYTNNEKTGSRVNRNEKNDVFKYYYHWNSKYGKCVSSHKLVPFYTKNSININETTNYTCNYNGSIKSDAIVASVLRKYPYLAFKIDILCNKVRIWNQKISATGTKTVTPIFVV